MARRFGAIAGTAAVVAVVPLLLARAAGVPSLGELPNLGGIKRAIDLKWVPLEWLVTVFAMLGWALWLYLAVAVLLRTAAHLEQRVRGTARLWKTSETVAWSPVRTMVDVAFGAALLASTVTNAPARAAAARGDRWAGTISSQVAAIRAESLEQRSGDEPRKAAREPAPEVERRRPQVAEYVVKPGDSLWSIAEKELGDPYRWVELWEMNQGREVAVGHHLTQPGFIRPGWTLRLPEHRMEKEHVARSEPREPRNGRNPGKVPPPSPPPTAAPTRAVESAPPAPTLAPSQPERSHDERVELPTGTAVTIGFVAGVLSALGMSELARRRRRTPRSPSPGWPGGRRLRTLRDRLLAEASRDVEPDAEVGAGDRMRHVESPPDRIVLGHRDGVPVVASERGRVYTVGGELGEVATYLRDVAIHAALSHRRRVEVWTTRDAQLGEVPAVRLFPDSRSLVSDLEIEILRRHRLFDEEGTADWERHESEWPDDALSIVLSVVPTVDPSLENRLRAVATQGHDLGILVMTIVNDAPALEVKEGSVRPLLEELGLGDAPFDPIRVADEDRRALVEELRTARADEPDVGTGPLQNAPAPQAEEPGGRIRVRLFGRPIIEAVDETGDGFGPKSREVLFLFLLNPNGLTRDEAIEMLWPEVEPEKGAQRFKFQLQKIRTHFRTDERPTAKFIERAGDVLLPQADLFDVDVWEFDRLIESAAREDSEAILAACADLYGGELLQGVYYPWADPIRGHFRERALDVLAKLAELRSGREDHEGALDAVRRAIAIDPFAEHLYRQAMTLYGTLGRTSDVHRIYNDLVALLADELEAEPDPETSELKDRLSSPAGRLGGR
ncbi:MAG: LysM peptidoglycan-binding domain-containing protein [Actinomycetota bacterium]|nr:LysM peptidoglycan-binding domain-containing protein [Actinomycetota bacterium]